MIKEFTRLAILKAWRSISLGRNIISGLAALGFVLFLLIYVVIIALFLGRILERSVGPDDVVPFLNTMLVFLFMFEVLYRFFFQKRPIFDLSSWLHLPIERKTIIHYLLGKSLLSPFTIVMPVLFTPFALNELSSEYGIAGALSWVLNLTIISICIHWFILWFRQFSLRSIWGSLFIFVVIIGLFMMAYFNVFVLGVYTRTFFDEALVSIYPLIATLSVCAILYYLNFKIYYKNAYLTDEKETSFLDLSNGIDGLFSRFGLAGELAETELRLILRHKKSRSYIFIAFATLLYGLFFYPRFDTFASSWNDVYSFMLFLGIFISGAFFIQYGQLLISWNSANFDFYMSKPKGLKALLRGKWLLFVSISGIFYLISLPYAYYGWEIAALQTVGFLYNIGIGVHIIMYVALWEPKPMDLNRSVFFNYEGVGIAQFLIMIPYLFIPYAIYIPISYMLNEVAGLFILSALGLAGLIFSDRLLEISATRLNKNRYRVASSFRNEL